MNPEPVSPAPTRTASSAPSSPRAADLANERAHGIDVAALLWVVMAVVGFAVFALFTVLLLDRVTMPFDQSILASVRPWVGDGTIWRILSESANYPLIVIGVGMVVVLFFTHRRREAVLVAVALIAITAGSEGVKQIVARPRPEGTDPNIPGVVYSYPSGHVLEALVIFGIIAIHVVRSRSPRWLAALVVVAVIVDVFLVGLSRIVLNAHWPSDAIASAFAAAGVLGIYGLLTHGNAWATKRSDRRDGRGREHGDDREHGEDQDRGRDHGSAAAA
jgi:membrane-associated phospholipid phosphatase